MHLSNSTLLRATAVSSNCKSDPNESPHDHQSVVAHTPGSGSAASGGFSVILRPGEETAVSSATAVTPLNADDPNNSLHRYTPTSNRVLLSMGQMRSSDGEFHYSSLSIRKRPALLKCF